MTLYQKTELLKREIKHSVTITFYYGGNIYIDEFYFDLESDIYHDITIEKLKDYKVLIGFIKTKRLIPDPLPNYIYVSSNYDFIIGEKYNIHKFFISLIISDSNYIRKLKIASL